MLQKNKKLKIDEEETALIQNEPTEADDHIANQALKLDVGRTKFSEKIDQSNFEDNLVFNLSKSSFFRTDSSLLQ